MEVNSVLNSSLENDTQVFWDTFYNSIHIFAMDQLKDYIKDSDLPNESLEEAYDLFFMKVFEKLPSDFSWANPEIFISALESTLGEFLADDNFNEAEKEYFSFCEGWANHLARLETISFEFFDLLKDDNGNWLPLTEETLAEIETKARELIELGEDWFGTFDHPHPAEGYGTGLPGLERDFQNLGDYIKKYLERLNYLYSVEDLESVAYVPFMFSETSFGDWEAGEEVENSSLGDAATIYDAFEQNDNEWLTTIAPANGENDVEFFGPAVLQTDLSEVF